MRLLRDKWSFLVVVSLAGLVLDQLTKLWATAALTPGAVRPIMGDTLSLLLIHNKGAVFGMNPAAWFPGFPVNGFFMVFTVIAAVVIALYYRSVADRDSLARWGLAFVMPGALGNLFDRVAHPGKGVVDFMMINLHFPPADPWPIFNAADIYVTVGVGLILLSIVRDEVARHKAAPAATASGPGPA